MIYGSVCSGIEAASCAWHPLGWRAAFLSEIEAFPRAVLKHHYPDVPLHGDFTTIEASQYEPIDLLVGGTPCQSFSVAGLRRGLADERGNLALEFLRLAQRLRPRWLVWENVPGVLSSNAGRDFGAFLGGLAELGYGWAYRVLDAQYFGVAQRRRRVFVVGYAGDWRRAAAVLLERHSLSWHPAPRREAGERTAASALRSTDGCSDVDHARAAQLIAHAPMVPPVAPCLTGNYGKQPDSSDTSAGPMLVPVAFTQNSRSEVRQIGGDGAIVGSLAAEPGAQQQNYLAVALCEGGHGLTEMPAVNTLQSAGGGKAGQGFAAVRHGTAVRRLTPRECERLQGLPDDYTLVPYRGKPAADGPRYKALGNSMAVPVMRWIGERITQVEALESVAASVA